RLVSQNIRSGRLRAFASPGLRAYAAQFFLGYPKACFSKHSQWPPESFRLAGLESLCCPVFPWMSE
ncbi:unnamed protein product, partial [Musa acuminata subsp. burmannicoides]